MQAKRLNPIKEYYFSTKLKEIAQLVAGGVPVINMGIGSPDLPPHRSVVARLQEVAGLDEAHSYQSYRGIAALREAMADFYERKYGVRLAADAEVLPLMGSKEGVMHIAMAFLDAGDEVLLPDPGYMTYTSATLLAGGVPVYYELHEENGFLPDLAALERRDLSKVKLMWLNYPHMPTGATASLKDFEALVDFARRNGILLVNDNPYSFILNDNPVSILQVDGAKEVALELNSLSKSHHLAGWRVGMLLGRSDLIDTVLKFKSQMDSGMFYAVQQAAVSALNLGDDWYDYINEIYSRRKVLVLELVEKLGLEARGGQAGLFVWAKLPEGQNSKDFSDRLLKDKQLFVAPGFIFGPSGDDYVRLSLTVPEETIREAIDRLGEGI